MTCFSCNSNSEIKPNLFEVTKQNVGLVTDSTLVKDLKIIFKNDSIINYKEDDSFIGGINSVDIYEKNGNPLLKIFPTDALDSTAKIDYVKLIDSRYKTVKGISNQSYFIDIKNAYTVADVKNEMQNLKIHITEIDADFIIAKKNLHRNFDFGIKVDTTMIADSTKIDAFVKYF